MSTDKIRVGVVGANPERSWAARAHLPGLSTLPDYEVTAVATSREESARAAAERFGARHAFTDGRELATSPDVDLVVVAVRVPAHFPLVEAAVAAGKHVYCEWPLGRTTKEAEVLAQAAAASSGHHAVGLQARLAPTVRYARQLIADGYVGQVTSASVRGARDRGTTNQIPGWAAYVLDRFSGAGTLEVAGGHTLDVLEQLLGPVVQLSGALATRRSDFVLAETGAPFQATAADNVLVQGRLADDTPVSVHLHDGRVTEARTTIEIAGTEGTLTLETTGAGAGAGIQISELRLTGSTLAEDGTPPRRPTPPAPPRRRRRRRDPDQRAAADREHPGRGWHAPRPDRPRRPPSGARYPAGTGRAERRPDIRAAGRGHPAGDAHRRRLRRGPATAPAPRRGSGLGRVGHAVDRVTPGHPVHPALDRMTEERAPVDRVAEGGTSARPAPADTAATLRIRATPADALRFARHWVRCWNERDLDGLLAHYADDVVVDSPTAARLRPDSGGRLRGKAELRDFWTYGLGLVSDLRFELTGLAVGPVTPAGPETIVLHYRNQAAQQVTEVFRVEGGKVVQATGTYRVELRAAVS